MLVFAEGGKPENPENNPQSKARTNNKLNPHMTPGPGFEPGPHWWEASALTTSPTLLSQLYISKATDLWYFWITFWKTFVNHDDFYFLNLEKVLSGGLVWSSRTVTLKSPRTGFQINTSLTNRTSCMYM